MCTGAALAAPQLLDERDALLQLRLARLELLHLRQHRAQLLRLGLGPRDVVVELEPTCWRSDQNHQPTPSAVAMRISAGGDRDALRRAGCRRAASWCRAAIDGEEVDANHRSPTRRSARPTATATVGAMSAADSTLNFFASNATVLNGSNGFDRRLEALGQHLGEALGARRAAAQHDAIDPIGGGRRLEEVERLLDLEHHVLGHRAQHRARVVVASRRRPACPRFSASAISNGRFSSFCSASV